MRNQSGATPALDGTPGLSTICLRCSCPEGQPSLISCAAFGLSCVFDEKLSLSIGPDHMKPDAPPPTAPREKPSEIVARLLREQAFERSPDDTPEPAEPCPTPTEPREKASERIERLIREGAFPHPDEDIDASTPNEPEGNSQESDGNSADFPSAPPPPRSTSPAVKPYQPDPDFRLPYKESD